MSSGTNNAANTLDRNASRFTAPVIPPGVFSPAQGAVLKGFIDAVASMARENQRNWQRKATEEQDTLENGGGTTTQLVITGASLVGNSIVFTTATITCVATTPAADITLAGEECP